MLREKTPYSGDDLFLEYRAAAHYGIIVDPTAQTAGSWYTLDRQARAHMTAYVYLSDLLQRLVAYDEAKKSEQRAAQAAAKAKGKR